MIDEKTKKKAIEAAADIYGRCLVIVSFSFCHRNYINH